MAKYGRKLEIIEAFKFVGGKEQNKYPTWIEDEIKEGNIYEIGDSINGVEGLKIKFHKGIVTADRGDYIIQGEKGQIYPCKPDIFEAIYEEVEEISDGYHTFNELYYHRMILFSVICNMNRGKAWKSWKHHDGSIYDDYFIVGINTPKGQYSYHYHKDHWDMFKVEALENAPEWDGHEPKDINRLMSLLQEVANDCRTENNEELNKILIRCDGKDIIINTIREVAEISKLLEWNRGLDILTLDKEILVDEGFKNEVAIKPRAVTLIKYINDYINKENRIIIRV